MYLGNTTVAGTLGIVGAATATTQAVADNTTKLATTAYVYQATSSAVTITSTGGSTTLAAAQYGVPLVIVTGTLTSGATLVVPNNGVWDVANRTIGSYPLLVATAAGTGTYVPQGGTLKLAADGSNVVAVGGKNPLVFAPYGMSANGGALPFLNGRNLYQGESSTTDVAGGSSRISFIPTVNSTGIRALFQNFLMPSSTETDALNPITISASFYDGTTVYALAFNGEPTCTLGNRGEVWTDPLGIFVTGAATFYGYISGATLTVTSLIAGTIPTGTSAVLNGPGVAFGTAISSGSGPYTVSTSQTVGSSGSPVLMCAGTRYWVTTYLQLAVAPSNVVCTAANSGGTLASATYYYKVTAVCGKQGESGPSTEVSGTTTGTGTMSLTWQTDPRSVSPTAFKIYRSTATGAESYLATIAAGPGPVPGAQYSWIDTGSIAQATLTGGTGGSSSATLTVASNSSNIPLTVGSYITAGGSSTTITTLGTGTGGAGTYTMAAAQTISTGTTISFGAAPQAQQRFPIGPCCQSYAAGEGYNYASENSGLATNQVATTGTAANWQSGQYGFVYGPCEVAGVPTVLPGKPVVVGIIGDSIETGQAGYTESWDFGPAAKALCALNIPYRLMTRAGERLDQQMVPLNFRSRAQLLGGCTHIIIESGTNDLNNGDSAATYEANLITMAINAGGGGAKVFTTTITPRVTTSDSGVTITNQTQQSWEAVRQAVNNWKRAGCPINASTLAAEAIGTSGAITVGQAGHPIFAVIDYCGQVEVNSSNALTVNGGYYAVGPIGGTPPGYAGTQDGIHPCNAALATFTGGISGTTLTTSAGTPVIGMYVTGTGVSASTLITAGSGTNWTVSVSQTVSGGTSMTGTPSVFTQALLSSQITAALFA